MFQGLRLFQRLRLFQGLRLFQSLEWLSHLENVSRNIKRYVLGIWILLRSFVLKQNPCGWFLYLDTSLPFHLYKFLLTIASKPFKRIGISFKWSKENNNVLNFLTWHKKKFPPFEQKLNVSLIRIVIDK